MPECGKPAGADTSSHHDHNAAPDIRGEVESNEFITKSFTHKAQGWGSRRGHERRGRSCRLWMTTAHSTDCHSCPKCWITVADGLAYLPGRSRRVSSVSRISALSIFVGFGSQDVWVLDDLRCSGADHDGCQRGCLIFWKTAWLRKVEANEPPTKPLGTDTEGLLRKLKTKTAPDRYFCQSTELAKATQPLSLMGALNYVSTMSVSATRRVQDASG